MQSTTTFQSCKENLQDITNLSGYELTYHTINTLSQYNITPVAKLVLVFLTTHYNQEQNSNKVFPSMQNIAETLGISLMSTKRAIKDLILEGLIIKTKMSRVLGNHNVYLLTHKVNKQSKSNKKKPIKKVTKCSTSCKPVREISNNHDHEVTPKPKAPKKVVVLNFNSNDDNIPTCIMQNKAIRSKKAYWASLSPTAKESYIKKDKELERIEARAKAFTKETKDLLNTYEEMKLTSEAPTQSWKDLREKLKGFNNKNGKY